MANKKIHLYRHSTANIRNLNWINFGVISPILHINSKSSWKSFERKLLTQRLCVAKMSLSCRYRCHCHCERALMWLKAFIQQQKHLLPISFLVMFWMLFSHHHLPKNRFNLCDNLLAGFFWLKSEEHASLHYFFNMKRINLFFLLCRCRLSLHFFDRPFCDFFCVCKFVFFSCAPLSFS